MSAGPSNTWLRAMPVVFVLIWSTGFIVARYGMPHAPPFTFLAWRYALSVACFLPWIVLARVAWPRERAQWLHLGVTGVLMHGIYLGGVWAAVKAGMGAGLVALLVGLQPVLTAVWLSAFAASTGLAVTRRQWLGLLLGLAGLVLVLWHQFVPPDAQAAVGAATGQIGATWFNVGLAVCALLSITAGTLYQKRYVQPCDVRSANAVQLLAALVVTLPLALMESEAMRWNGELIGALAWSVLVLSVGGSSLLYMLIQRGAAASVASLMYLVPPCTALMAWLLFGEPITPTTLLGTAITAFGVSLVVRSPR